MPSWNFADVLEMVATIQPNYPAIRQGARELRYEDLLRQVNSLGVELLEHGATLQDKVAIYCHNSPEYLIATMAALHVRLVPVNTNYRYGDDELVYLWDNADCVAVVFHGSFTERVGRIRGRCDKVTTWIHVDDHTTPCPEWAEPFEVLCERPRPLDFYARTGDDLVLLYTGGTTGMPKGVMWAQDDLFRRLNNGGFRRYDHEASIHDLATMLARDGAGAKMLPACPLMHGTGLFSSLECFVEGGCVVLLESAHFSSAEMIRTIKDVGVHVAVIVGDPFARPMLDALTASGDPEAIASLFAIVSSGAMWSEEVKQGLLGFNQHMLLIDAFSSSEALGMGNSVVGAVAGSRHTAEFSLGPGVRVIDEQGNDVVAGSDAPGLLALAGRIPLGYYKDDEKTNATFKVIDGVRYSIPGDWAKVAADGSIQLLGRGSQCINTGGEKVFPEEVEEVLKRHGAVRDACVVGVPDERYGEVVMAVVELDEGATATEAALIDHVRAHLSHYKAPRRVRVAPTIGRTPSGKMDYARYKREMAEWVGAQA